jgi:hypothetical protein
MLITIDIPWRSLSGFRSLCKAYRIEIQQYEEGRPDGNPCFHLAVGDADALAMLGRFILAIGRDNQNTRSVPAKLPLQSAKVVGGQALIAWSREHDVGHARVR